MKADPKFTALIEAIDQAASMSSPDSELMDMCDRYLCIVQYWERNSRPLKATDRRELLAECSDLLEKIINSAAHTGMGRNSKYLVAETMWAPGDIKRMMQSLIGDFMNADLLRR